VPGYTPWMGTVTLPLANRAYCLLDLLQALPVTVRPLFDVTTAVQFATVQANEDGAANIRYYIGNVALSATFKGTVIFATQTYPIYSMNGNMVRLDHIYLMATGDNETFNVTFIQR